MERETRPIGDQHRSATAPREGQRAVVQQTRVLGLKEGTRAIPGTFSEVPAYTECHTNGVRTVTKAGNPCKGKVIEAGHCFAH